MFPFFLATLIPARRQSYVIIFKIVQFFQHIDWYRAVFDYGRDVFPESPCSALAMKATAYASGGIGMSLYSPKKATIMNGYIVIQQRWANTSAFAKKVFKQLIALFMFLTEIFP